MDNNEYVEENTVEYYDNQLSSLKDTVKQLKKIKRRKRKIRELEKERDIIMKNLTGKHGKR